MATFEEIKGTGMFNFTQSADYDTTLHDEPTEITVHCACNGLKARRIGRFGGENVDCVTTVSGVSTEYNVESYGRLCLKMDFRENDAKILDEPVRSIQDIGAVITMYGANESGNFVKLLDNIIFNVDPDSYVTSYSGENEGLRNILLSVGDPRFGYGLMFGSNTPWIPVYGTYASYSVDVPVFQTTEDVENYVRTGVPTNDINETPEREDVDTKNAYYYIYDKYNIDSDRHTKEFDFQRVEHIILKNPNDRIAFVAIGDNKYELQCTANDIYVGYYTGSGDVQKIEYRDGTFDEVAITIIRGDGGDVWGDITTNIEFVNDLSEATGKPIRNLYPTYNGIDDDTTLTELNVATLFTLPYYLSLDQLNALSKIIYSSDVDLIESLKKGLWMYNSNPIDAIIDVCYYPFDLSVFINSTRNMPFKFGAFTYNGEIQSVPASTYPIIVGTHKTFTIVNQKIMPIYRDFRDYNNVSYQLFLPYYGVVPLNNDIVGNVLKIECKFDALSSQLKYYLFNNGVLINNYECPVGRHIAVIGNDWVDKSTRNIETTLSGAVGTATGLVGGVTSLASGDIGGINSVSSSVGTFLSSFKNVMQPPNVSYSGTTTSGMNIYDPMSVFLIVEQYETIKPNNLNIEYGVPCYKIDKMSICRGYTEIADIKLRTFATDEERNEIINLLRAGVII